MYEPRDLRAAIALGREPGALVIWSWPKGEMALYRHLRTLNLVKIPNEARAEAEAEGEDVSGMPACETVLFRHWDPNVLGTLLALLDGPQQARFLGAATGLAFDATDLGRLMAAPRPAGLPAAAPGMLRFSPEQMSRLGDTRQEAIYDEIARDLLECWPNGIERLPRAATLTIVREQDGRATNLRLEGTRALTYLCMLRIALPDALREDAGLVPFLSDPANGRTRDVRMERFYDIVLESAGRQ